MSKTILMIHGMWGGAWIWENFRKFFSDLGYNCIIPNLPYHHKLNKYPAQELGNLTLHDYTEFLKTEINKLDEKPIIFGHSMGGLLTQILTSQALSQASIIFNPVPPGDISSFSIDSLRCMKLVLLKSLFQKPVLIKFKAMKYSAFNMIPQENHNELYNKLVHDSGRVFLELAIPKLAKYKISYINEKNILSPILIIGSKYDRTIPWKIVRKIAIKYPTADFKVFPDNAHWIIVEPNWQEVASYVNIWLNKIFNKSR